MSQTTINLQISKDTPPQNPSPSPVTPRVRRRSTPFDNQSFEHRLTTHALLVFLDLLMDYVLGLLYYYMKSFKYDTDAMGNSEGDVQKLFDTGLVLLFRLYLISLGVKYICYLSYCIFDTDWNYTIISFLITCITGGIALIWFALAPLLYGAYYLGHLFITEVVYGGGVSMEKLWNLEYPIAHTKNTI